MGIPTDRTGDATRPAAEAEVRRPEFVPPASGPVEPVAPEAPRPFDEFVRAEDSNEKHFYLGKGPIQGWRRMLSVNPSLRSWLSGAMIYIESTIEFLSELDVDDITHELQRKLPLVAQSLEEIVQDLKSPYLDNGSLSLLALERIQNILFRDKAATMLRLNVNLTDANKVDTSQNLGTAYKVAVLKWLQQEFGQRHISLNPEGSSYLAINVSRHEISCSLGRFAREISYSLRRPEFYEKYGFDPGVLDQFMPAATGMFMRIDEDDLEFRIDETLKSTDAEAILKLQSSMIQNIEASLRLLAVGSTIAEKEPGSVGLAAGMAVYDSSDLPLTPGMTGYELLEERVALGTGYVPPSLYLSQYGRGTPTVDDEFRTHPRYAHDFGHLDHPKRQDTDGGRLQQLQDAILALSVVDQHHEKEFLLEEVKSAARRFSLALDIGRIARSNPRNHSMVKWIQEVNLSNGATLMDPYFMERVALRPEPKIHIIAVEIDSFKAFSENYAVDEQDSSFWGVFDPIFEEAEERGIDQPLISQIAGDLVAIAVPAVDSAGKEVDIGEFVSSAQDRISEKYADMPFQDRAKVKIRNGGEGFRIDRQPLWQKGNAVFPSERQPRDSEPFLNTLSITAVATTGPTPRNRHDLDLWMRNIAEMASSIDPLKERHAPYKGGYDFHEFEDAKPQSDGEQSVSGLYRGAVEEKRDLIAERFVRAMDAQFREAWGDDWDGMSAGPKQEFINLLRQRAESSPAILMPDEVVDVLSQLSGVAMAQFPPPPILFMPSIAGIAI